MASAEPRPPCRHLGKLYVYFRAACQICQLICLFCSQKQSTTRSLILVSGFIHDVSAFLDAHPGGAHLLTKYVGEDATAAFFGGVYDHSNAAHNVSPISAFEHAHCAYAS